MLEQNLNVLYENWQVFFKEPNTLIRRDSDVLLGKWLPSKEMDTEARGPALNEVVCISHITNVVE